MRKKNGQIFWFAHYGPQCPSFRYRAKYPLERIESTSDIGFNLYYPSRTIKGVFNLFSSFTKAVLSSPSNSLIVFQKICSRGPYAFLMRVLAIFKSNTLLDIDDAEYLRKDNRTLNFLIKHSTACTVGSKALYKYCSQYNENVTLSTSPVIDHNQFKLNRTISKPLHLGWVGDTGNGNPVSRDFSHKLSLLELLFPAIIQSGIDIKLSLFGVKDSKDISEFKEYFKCHDKVTLIIPENLAWESDEWIYSEIKKMDFGLSPMVDHPFNRAKSAFKAKQYLSVGVPTIVSSVGENSDFVKDGKNGFICTSVDDFSQAFVVARNMSLSEYERLSKNAILGSREYSLDHYCAILSNLVAQANRRTLQTWEQKKEKRKNENTTTDIPHAPTNPTRSSQ